MLTLEGQLYEAPGRSLATPVIAWLAPKTASVTTPRGPVATDQQASVGAALDPDAPIAAMIANADGSGKFEQRTVSVTLDLIP